MLKLHAFTQLNLGTCKHYTAILVADGQTLTAETSLNQLQVLFDDFPGGYKQALVMALIRYRLEQGVPIELLTSRVRIV